MGDSLIGKTVDSGSIVPGSSPGLPDTTSGQHICWSFFILIDNFDHSLSIFGSQPLSNKRKTNIISTRREWSNHKQSIRLMVCIYYPEKSDAVILNPLTPILILALFTTVTIFMLSTITISRITRIIQLESRIAQTVQRLDTTQLQTHLQTIPISAIEIDAEVAALKADIITAAHKHHLTIDRDETQPDNPFDLPENRERLIKIVEKQDDVAARVG